MRARAPSLRRALLLNLLVPTGVLAAMLWLAGSWLIANTVDTAFDRVLDGSARAIAERVTNDKGAITVDLPAVALKMLETPDTDSIYYGVSYQGKSITGYQDLPSSAWPAPGVVGHADVTYHGQTIRLATLLKRVYGMPEPVIVEVAETLGGRNAVKTRLYGALAALELGIVIAAALLGWFAVERGLKPLAALKRDIDERGVEAGSDLRPLDLAEIPHEVRSPVAAINLLFGRLDRAFQLVRDFTANASHQMKSPLASLWVHLRLLQRMQSDNPAREALGEIERSTKHLDRLIGQLLALARADQAALMQGIKGGDRARIDLTETAADIVAYIAPIALEKNIELRFEADPNPIHAAVNGDLVHEVLNNLIDNAIRYNRMGGRVTIRIERRDGQPAVSVLDDGPGIPLAMRDRVFDRFYRVPKENQPSGAGLGLPIVLSFVEQAGGTLFLSDGLDGQGLGVTVVLPG